MAYTREQIVALAMKYKGAVRGSAKHKDLIDTFNKVKPHGQKMTYTWAWCAATVTAWLIKGGYTPSNMPMSYSCAQLIKDTKALEKKGLGKWVENDAWKGAEPGDLIIYYWHASKTGDQKKYTSHVGMITERTSTGYIVIEGNKNNKVGMRTVPFDWRYIRGFCHLKYDDAKPKELAVDGKFGPLTIKALQKWLGVAQDGKFGPVTIKALQKKLNDLGVRV